MANTTLPRYSPSGFFRPTTIGIFLAAAGVAFVAAWLYQLIMHYNPIIYLSLLVCGGFGFALGAAGAYGVKIGHCRNRLIALLCAVPLAAAAVGGSFWWEYKRFIADATEEVQKKEPNITSAQVQEFFTFDKFIDIKKEAGWEVSSHGGTGSKFNGWGVYFVWGVEAAILVGIALFMAFAAATEPYCERCNQWGKETKILIRGLTAADAEPHLASGDLDAALLLSPPPEIDEAVALTYAASLCPSCKDTGFVTIEEKRIVARKKGKPQEAKKTLVVNAVMRADQRDKLLGRLTGGVTAAAPSPSNEPPAPIAPSV